MEGGLLALAQFVYLSNARRPSHTSMNSTVQHFLLEALSNICVHNLPEQDTTSVK